MGAFIWNSHRISQRSEPYDTTVVVGILLKIDLATISMYQGLYARVLIDVNVSKRLPEILLASLKT